MLWCCLFATIIYLHSRKIIGELEIPFEYETEQSKVYKLLTYRFSFSLTFHTNDLLQIAILGVFFIFYSMHFKLKCFTIPLFIVKLYLSGIVNPSEV